MPASMPHTFVDGVGNVASGEDVMDNLDAVNAGVHVATVTSLPGSPVNGQDIYYLADATNGVVWHLKYRAASASAYKWEFAGGPDLTGYVATSETMSGAPYTNLGTAGPDVTVPLAGDYDYQMEANGYSETAGISNVFIGLSVGGAVPALADIALHTAPAASHQDVIHRTGRKTGLAASTLLRIQYAAQAGITARFLERRLRVRPVRVG